MKKILFGLVCLISLFLASCSVLSQDKCVTLIDEGVSIDGNLFKTSCKDGNLVYYGLVNENFEYVIKEQYADISYGLGRFYNVDGLVFDENIKYFKVRIRDTAYSYTVIDRFGNQVIEPVDTFDIMISQDEDLIYISGFDGNRIYDIKNESYVDVDYMISDFINGYYIAYSYFGQEVYKQIILDESFNVIEEDSYERVNYITDQILIYTREGAMYKLDRDSRETTMIFNTDDYPNYAYDLETGYIFINPNENISFLDVETLEYITFDDTYSLFDYNDKYIILDVGDAYNVYSVDSFEFVHSIDKENTEIIPRTNYYFDFNDDEVYHLVNINEKLQLAYDTKYNYTSGILEIMTDQYQWYFDLEDLESLYIIPNTCSKTKVSKNHKLLIAETQCTLSEVNRDVSVLYTSSRQILRTDVEILGYTDDYIILLKDGNTIITDWDLNILFD